MHPLYTHSELQSFNRTQLWQLCRERGAKCYPKRHDCVEAIQNLQQSVELVAVAEIKVDEPAQDLLEQLAHIRHAWEDSGDQCINYKDGELWLTSFPESDLHVQWEMKEVGGWKTESELVDEILSLVKALEHSTAQVEFEPIAVKVDEQTTAQTEAQYVETQAQVEAPEIQTVEITFYDHEVYALGKQIASITHDTDDFQTQRWVVMVGETEVHRANAWAKCFEYVRWHYKQGTLPVAPNAQAEVPLTIPGDNFCCSQGIEFKQRTGSETGTTYWYAVANHYYNQPGRSYKTTSFPKLEDAVSAAVDYLGKCGVDVAEVKQLIVDRKRNLVQDANNFTTASALLRTSPNLQDAETPSVEVDSDIDADFGVLYRVWAKRTLLGTFYRAADDKWVAMPCDSEERPRCNTAAEAQLFIVSQHKKKTNLDKLLDKPFDELTVPEWEQLKQHNADLQQKLELAYTNSNFGCYNRAGAEAKGNEFLLKERRRVASGELVMVCCDIAGLGKRNSEIGEPAVNEAVRSSLNQIRTWRGIFFISQLNSGDEFVFIVDKADAVDIIPRMNALFQDAGFEGIYGAVEPINDDYIKSANDGMELVYKLKEFAKTL